MAKGVTHVPEAWRQNAQIFRSAKKKELEQYGVRKKTSDNGGREKETEIWTVAMESLRRWTKRGILSSFTAWNAVWNPTLPL